MQSPAEFAKRRLPAFLYSCALHALAFTALVLLFGARARLAVIDPGQPRVVAEIAIAGASHAVPIPLPPADLAAHTRLPVPHTEPLKKTILPMPSSPSTKSGGGAPRVTKANDGKGKALGEGTDALDERPAFPIFSPHPPVADRTLLPATEMQIVVDVRLDALGTVVSAKLVKGIGNRLDQIALETVKNWRFQPATVDGKPVATEAEVIFPFNPNYPIASS